MAALLRSARLLKLSPSGLLQITGTKRNGPPLGRLYSVAFGGGKPGVCARQAGLASGNTSSRVWPCAVGCVRNYTLATQQNDEATSIQSKMAKQFEWSLGMMDSSVRRTGRVPRTLLLRIFHELVREGYASNNHALLLLRSCGSLLPEVPPNERTELAHRVWKRLQELGVVYDVSHYNALLKVYLQNEFKFSPTDFLTKMESATVQPNRVTYQSLVTAYCQNGDIEGATTILGVMKTNGLPITEAVFNSLVTGHARAGDIESAENILVVMRGAGIEPGPDTYLSLLNAYAEKGDLDSLKQTMESARSANCSLIDRDIIQVIFTLAKAGHKEHIPDLVESLRRERGYIPDAMNLCLNLITNKQEDIAFEILKTFPMPQSDSLNTDTAKLGSFFLKHCVNTDTPLEKIGSFCKEMQESNRHSTALNYTLLCALQAKNIGMSFGLMKMMKEGDLPIRPHYFWPILTQHIKNNNTAGVVEVLNNMQELGVSVDVETISQYISPAFPSVEAAQQALTDAGISAKSDDLLSSEVRALAYHNPAALYTKLSDPFFPAMNPRIFRKNIIEGFRKSYDVNSMVKITELLFKDDRFFSVESDNASEQGSFMLYHLINSMSKDEVLAHENQLRKYFNQLHAQNITISVQIYKGIRNLLQSCNAHDLIKDVHALVDSKSQLNRKTGIEGTALALEKELAELEAQDKPLDGVLTKAIKVLCAEENLPRALELKQKHEAQMTSTGYATLIGVCCRNGEVEEALNLKREMSSKDSLFTLDPTKYIALVQALSSIGKVEEAVDILKEMKGKMVSCDAHTTLLFHMLNDLVANGDIATIRRLQETIFTLELAKPTANLCAPLVTAYLNRNDLSGALDTVLDCRKLYNNLPRIHDVLCVLVEKGETTLLQKAMDALSQDQGGLTMLYGLFFAFLQTGRFPEARKIIETPGLRSQPRRLQWFAEKCIHNKQMEVLEQMLDITARLFQCDRDEMYNYALRLCKKLNNWQKAEALWMKMQEENVVPRQRTMLLLADILKSSGQELPFVMSEAWYEQAASTEAASTEAASTEAASTKAVATEAASTEAVSTHQVKTETSESPPKHDIGYPTRLFVLCKNGNAKEAFLSMQEEHNRGVSFSAVHYDYLIRALLAQGSLEDALAVKDMAVSHMPGFTLSEIASNLIIITYSKKGHFKEALKRLNSIMQENRVPSRLAITRLIQALGNHGEVATLQELESLINDLCKSLNLSSMVFTNNTALAHIYNGDVDKAVELLEAVYTSENDKMPSMSFVFKKVLEEDNDKAIDQLSVMAERLANHFACYGPVTDLFLQLLYMDKVEDAKFLLARCNAVAEQKTALTSFLFHNAEKPGQLSKIKALMSLIPDFADKKTQYPFLIKSYVQDNDLPSAKALYEEMQEEGIVINELSLKRLASLYHKAGETTPFTEPPNTFRFYANKLRQIGKPHTMADL